MYVLVQALQKKLKHSRVEGRDDNSIDEKLLQLEHWNYELYLINELVCYQSLMNIILTLIIFTLKSCTTRGKANTCGSSYWS